MRADLHHRPVGQRCGYAAARDGRPLGFTLVEVSIVLVVIGLLVGGILVGRDLIHTAELRGVISEIHQYQTAAAAYRLKFGGTPGDHRDAYTFWGDACGTNDTIDFSDYACNGNGDGLFANVGGVPPDFAYIENWGEGLLAWKHMGLAGLIAFVPKSPSPDFSYLWIGYDYPPSRIQGAGYEINHESRGNYLMLGSPNQNNARRRLQGGSLTPADAFYIDNKMDDGGPEL